MSRLRNIARRMAEGETYYLSEHSPRITKREIAMLWEMGFPPQEEHEPHEPHEPHIAYCEHDEREAWLKRLEHP